MANTMKCSGRLQHLMKRIYTGRNGMCVKRNQVVVGPAALANCHRTGIAVSSGVPSQMGYDVSFVAKRSFSTKSSHPDPKFATVNQAGYVVPRQQSEQEGIMQLFSEVSDDADKRTLVVKWEDGQVQDYPYVWLRDNCRCEDCFYPHAFCRSFSFPELDVNIRPTQFRLSSDQKKIELQWKDGHNSSYGATWLHQYRFEQSRPDLTFDSKKLYWDSSHGDLIKEYDLEELVDSDECLYDWILQMQIVGAALVKAQPKEGEISRIGARVSFLRTTDYGYTSHVKSRFQGAYSLAFTNLTFPIHLDLIHRQRPPGALLLHCIEQAKGEGGESWIVDGFKVAEDLRRDNPEAFEILAKTELEFFDIGDDLYGKFHQRSRHPTISVDSLGRLVRINVSDHGRDAMLRIPTDRVGPLYNALKMLTEKIYEKKNIYAYKLKEGDILIIDNRRVLHGRNAFETTVTSSRHLETGYLEWDDIYSRLRVLHRQLGYDV